MALKYKASALFAETINELMGWSGQPWHYSSQRSIIGDDGIEIFTDRYPQSKTDWDNGMCFMNRETATEKPKEEWPCTYEQFVALFETKIADLPMRALRLERDKRLAATDWMSSSDRVMTQEEIDYRQALRDITVTCEDPENPIWPTPPPNSVRYGPNNIVANRPQPFK